MSFFENGLLFCLEKESGCVIFISSQLEYSFYYVDIFYVLCLMHKIILYAIMPVYQVIISEQLTIVVLFYYNYFTACFDVGLLAYAPLCRLVSPKINRKVSQDTCRSILRYFAVEPIVTFKRTYSYFVSYPCYLWYVSMIICKDFLLRINQRKELFQGKLPACCFECFVLFPSCRMLRIA